MALKFCRLEGLRAKEAFSVRSYTLTLLLRVSARRRTGEIEAGADDARGERGDEVEEGVR